MICQAELASLLLDVQGATPVTFSAVTDADVKAKDQDKNPCPFARPIWKHNRVNGLVCFWYDKAVLRRLAKEGKSEDAFRQGTSWHVPVLLNGRLTPLCQSKSETNRKLYVRFLYVQTIGEPRYLDSHGTEIDKAALLPWLPSRKNNYANQGLDNPVVILTYALDSLREITLNGQTFAIADAKAAVA